MSRAILFTQNPNDLTPSSDLSINRQANGMTTASMSFTCKKFALDSTTVRTKLVKGTSLTVLYPEMSSNWNFLRVDTWTSDDQPGGWCKVLVQFKGADPSGGDFGFEGSVIYTRNNALAEDSIFNNPTMIDQCDSYTRETIRLGLQGIVQKTKASTASSYNIRFSANDAPRDELTDENHRWWWDHVVGKGNETYLAPTSEWTKSATGKGVLQDFDFTNFGKIDIPEGNPGTPPDKQWLYTGVTETISQSGDGANSYSKTWTLGKYEERVYQ